MFGTKNATNRIVRTSIVAIQETINRTVERRANIVNSRAHKIERLIEAGGKMTTRQALKLLNQMLADESVLLARELGITTITPNRISRPRMTASQKILCRVSGVPINYTHVSYRAVKGLI
jgi:hypothetical protein